MFRSPTSRIGSALVALVVVAASVMPAPAQYPGQPSRPRVGQPAPRQAPLQIEWRPLTQYFQIANVRMGRDGYGQPALLFDVTARGEFDDPLLYAHFHLVNRSRSNNNLSRPQQEIATELVHFQGPTGGAREHWRPGMRGIGSVTLPSTGPGSAYYGSAITGVRFSYDILPGGDF